MIVFGAQSKAPEEEYLSRLQGYCAGLLAGCCVAVSADETELVRNACKMYQLAVGVSAYGDLGGSYIVKGPTSTVVVRLSREDQMDEIT